MLGSCIRLQERDDPVGKADRKRGKTTKTDAEVFDELEGWFGDRDYTLKRRHGKLTEHREYMLGTFPVAIVRSGDGYEIKTIAVSPPWGNPINTEQSTTLLAKTLIACVYR